MSSRIILKPQLLLMLAAVIALVQPTPFASGATPDIGARFVPEIRSAPVDGRVKTVVEVALPSKTQYLQVRMRIFSEGGDLVHQKTEIRHDVKGTVRIPFSRDLAGTGLPEGRYRTEADVYASGPQRTTANGTLLLYDPDRSPVDVAVVLRLKHVPMTDPQGRFVVDPVDRASTVTRDAAVELEGALARTGAPLTMALPPMMLADWRHIASGYRTAGLAGEQEFTEDSPQARSYEIAASALSRISRSGRAELLYVPYAEPDMRLLKDSGAIDDLSLQMDLSAGEYRASLATTPGAGFAVLGDVLPADAVPVLTRQGLSYAIVRGSSVAGEKLEAGPHAVRDTTMTALVTDHRLTNAVAKREDILDALFGMHAEAENGAAAPHVIVMEIGPGEAGSVARLEKLLRDLRGLPWVRLMTAEKAAEASPHGKVRMKQSPWPGRQAPYRYRREVMSARRHARALSQASGERDRDAEYAVSEVLLAQSRAWAGPDNSWALSERGLAHAAAARRRSDVTLDAVSLQCSDITLSGSSGKVPVSIMNRSEKELEVVLRLLSPGIGFPEGAETTVSLKPNENYVTIPVDLGRRAAGDVKVVVSSAEMPITTARLEVRASYLDRLAMVGLVVMVLVGLLFFIRKRMPRDVSDRSSWNGDGPRG